MPESLLIEWPYGRSGPPSIPDRMRWSPSAVKMWRSCKRKFFWRYILGLSHVKPILAPKVGTATHDCLQMFYEGRDPTEVNVMAEVKALELSMDIEKNSEYFDEKELIKAEQQLAAFPGMVAAYMENYASDQKDFSAVEAEPYWKLEFDEFDYVGKIDLVLQKGKSQYLMETKTAGQITDTYFTRLALDTQARSYVYAMRELGHKPRALIYNVIRKSALRRKSNEPGGAFHQRVCDDYMSRPNHYFVREDLRYNSEDLANLEQEIMDVHWEYMTVVESGEDLMNPKTWGINDGACTDFFKLCEFFSLCTHGLDKGSGLHYSFYDRTKSRDKS